MLLGFVGNLPELHFRPSALEGGNIALILSFLHVADGFGVLDGVFFNAGAGHSWINISLTLSSLRPGESGEDCRR